jgi:hypothetical protein
VYAVLETLQGADAQMKIYALSFVAGLVVLAEDESRLAVAGHPLRVDEFPSVGVAEVVARFSRA